MKCKRCLERGKNWNGSDPVCYLENDKTWACESLILVREKIFCTGNYLYNSDEYLSSIVITDDYWEHNDELPAIDFILITWYKRRGRSRKDHRSVQEQEESVIKRVESDSTEFNETQHIGNFPSPETSAGDNELIKQALDLFPDDEKMRDWIEGHSIGCTAKEIQELCSLTAKEVEALKKRFVRKARVHFKVEKDNV